MKSLHSLAANVGVNHKTIRVVLRHERAVVGRVLAGNAGGQ
jgi:hypothetical protein